ncbi:LysM peptidoglycan-binding domain-containing protein [Gryllotalpicola protaetiae]|uniref:LysM peptidoglycan-binding domain-containing protein n=1 Tax=Gryllotalpicola protaetiae TaxID=2419771 RepID=A0A387BPB0_9MICO|nr:LysM peptidoglycan-binding domain-containing protein [Gryllotalpicola protaetiae]AYG04548.1 LysM peptidoglycan-binding domain-containing protein [Gryllotalpicola protaetiae]
MSSVTVHLSAAGARSHLRLTRRGRVVLVALAATPLVAAALWFGVNSGFAAAGGEPPASTAALEHVTVTPGESLWQIAEAIAPHDDPRDVVDALVDMNGLQGSVVTPGQTLAVPPQYAK